MTEGFRREDLLTSHMSSSEEAYREWQRQETERLVMAEEENLKGIRVKLERGTDFIKKGHKVKGLNPEGIEMEVPLSEARRERLERMEYRLLHGSLDGYVSPADRRYAEFLRQNTEGLFPFNNPRSLPNL